MSRRVLVVGGGLAGLLAARRHQRAGHRVVLLEATGRLGGAIAATDLAGTSINTGAEAFAIASGATDALLAELGLADQVVSPRHGLGSHVVSAAGAHPAPSRAVLGIPARPAAADVRAVLGTGGALRAAAERWLPARYGAREGATVAEVVRRRLGPAVLERLVAPVVGGVHSADPATLEFAAASPALSRGLREHGSLTMAVRRQLGAGHGGNGSPRPRSGGSAGTRVRSLTPTMAALPAALEQELLAGGGILRTGVEVVGLERADGPGPNGCWRVRTARDEHLEAEQLVLACPPDTAAALLEQAAPQVAAAIPQAPSAPVRLVALLVDAPALDAFPAGTGALVAPGTPGLRAKALTHASAKWEHVARGLRAAQPSAASPHLLRLSYGRPGEQLPGREQIVDLALADASRILRTALGRDQLIDAQVIDWDRAMRQPGPGHRASLEALTGLLAEQPSLDLVGSWRAGTGIDAIVRAAHSPMEGTPA